MRIVVVVEAILDPKQVRISQSQGVAVTAGADIIASPGSREAVAVARALKNAGDEIVALGTGGPAAEDAIREIMAAGADAGTLCTDATLSEPDGAASAVVLAQALRQLQPVDLVIAGAGELGPRLAEALGLPGISGAADVTVSDGRLQASRRTGEGWEQVEVALPAVIGVVPDPLRPSAPFTGIMAAYHDKPVTTWVLGDLGLDPDQVKPATELRRTYAAPRAKEKIESSPEEAARQLAQRLKAGGWIS